MLAWQKQDGQMMGDGASEWACLVESALCDDLKEKFMGTCYLWVGRLRTNCQSTIRALVYVDRIEVGRQLLSI